MLENSPLTCPWAGSRILGWAGSFGPNSLTQRWEFGDGFIKLSENKLVKKHEATQGNR